MSRLVFWLGAVLGITAFIVTVITRDCGYISFVWTILLFLFLPDVFGLVCCWAVGLGVRSLDVVLTHGGASPSLFSPFSTCLLLLISFDGF